MEIANKVYVDMTADDNEVLAGVRARLGDDCPPGLFATVGYDLGLHPLREHFHRVAERRGTNKARTATARRLMTLAYYGLSDGEIRCLTQRAAA
jgi:hypothetical protein